MKNTLLVLALTFAVAFSTQAQDSSTTISSDFKPVAGDKTIEAGSGLQGIYYGGSLKFRKFTSDQKAFRLSTNIQFDYNRPSDDVTYFYSVVSIKPGIERHFTGTSRLSPYIGAELPLATSFSKYEDSEKTINGGWYDGSSYKAFSSVGLNAVTGVDFYIVKNFYVGLEFGAGIAYRKYHDVEIDMKQHDFNDRKIEGGSGISLNTFANGGFRIGFVF